MHNDSIERLWKSLRTPSLSADEKSVMRAQLSERMREPLPVAKKSPYWFGMFSVRYAYVGAFVVIVFVFGTVSISAEQALPGSTLYSVKRNINEPFLSALSLSNESQAKWQVSVAERRLFEAAALASRDTLDDSALRELGTAVRESASAFAKAMNSAESDDSAYELSSRFEATLSAHSAFIDAMLSKASGQDIASVAADASAPVVGLMMMQIAPAEESSRVVPVAPAAEPALMKAAAVSIPGGISGDIRSAAETVTLVRIKREENIRGKSGSALLATYEKRAQDVREDLAEFLEDVSDSDIPRDALTRIDERTALAEDLLRSAEAVSRADVTTALDLVRQAQAQLLEARIELQSHVSKIPDSDSRSMANALSATEQNKEDDNKPLDSNEDDSNNADTLRGKSRR